MKRFVFCLIPLLCGCNGEHPFFNKPITELSVFEFMLILITCILLAKSLK